MFIFSFRLMLPITSHYINLISRKPSFMVFLMKRFICSNLLILLLNESLEKFVISKSLYIGWSSLLEHDLKQSLRTWFERFASVVYEFGLRRSQKEHSISFSSIKKNEFFYLFSLSTKICVGYTFRSWDVKVYTCNAPIPRIQERYDDVHTQGENTLTYVR